MSRLVGIDCNRLHRQDGMVDRNLSFRLTGLTGRNRRSRMETCYAILRRALSVMFLAIVAVAILVEDCAAYIDPSTGSYVLQILLAGLLGALFTVKMFWRRIVSYFKKSSAKEADQSDDR